MAEKRHYTISDAVPGREYSPPTVENKQDHIGEAAELYGDIQTAEDYGYVHRGCVMA